MSVSKTWIIYLTIPVGNVGIYDHFVFLVLIARILKSTASVVQRQFKFHSSFFQERPYCSNTVYSTKNHRLSRTLTSQNIRKLCR